MRELALFAGAGGGILGSKMLGWRTVCAVEYEQYPASVLAARQNDGSLEAFPIWSDVRTFDGKPWRGIVDVVSGGFPCQDISSAGTGAGIEGSRSGLWSEMARIVGEVRPRYVWVENSPLLISRGLGLVLLDLAKMGFNARWGIVGANDAGAPHQRDRCWVMGWNTDKVNECTERELFGGSSSIAKSTCRRQAVRQGKTSNTYMPQRKRECVSIGVHQEHTNASDTCWWSNKSPVGRISNGVEYRVDRLKAIGNGQVPQAMKLAWDILSDGVAR